MPIVAVVAALVAAVVHAWFFVLESVRFRRPEVAARFGLRTPEQVEAVAPMALNQGFYNLFLAIGVVVGLGFVGVGQVETGKAVVLFGCACMAGAGIVLALSSPRLARAAAVQAVPPMVAIVAAVLVR